MTDPRLNILQVNTFDVGGGAAKVAWDLFTAYRSRGHHSLFAVGFKQSNDPDVLPIPNRELRGTWSRFWWNRQDWLETLSRENVLKTAAVRATRSLAEPRRFFDIYRGREDFDHPGSKSLVTLAERLPDILHLHNLHGGYFDLRALPQLSRCQPTILTLHDAWLLSGHCAHSFGCERWRTGCGACPDLTVYPAIRRDSTANNWLKKRSIYETSQLFVATPSRWLMKKVEQSMLAPAVHDARVIPNGVDLGVFQPADKRRARAACGVVPDDIVILFVANRIRDNRWKDFETIRRSMAKLSSSNHSSRIVFLALGETSWSEWVGSVRIQYMPYESDPTAVARCFQAADIYVHAAHVDTFPSTIMEAMACGTPVVATAVGGIPEQVVDGKNGFLVPAGDSDLMTQRIGDLVADSSLRERVRTEARRFAKCHFDLSRQVDSYLRWYSELLREPAQCRF